MSTLTIRVDDEALKRARLRALQEGISVNAVVRGCPSTNCRLWFRPRPQDLRNRRRSGATSRTLKIRIRRHGPQEPYRQWRSIS